METIALTRGFVLDYLSEIGASVQENEGVYTVAFPPGRKRAFGRQRRLTFDSDRRTEGIELLEPGSPFLKLLLLDAKKWGPLALWGTNQYPPGTRIYTFQFDAYSSVRKRTQFAWALVPANEGNVEVRPGLPEVDVEGEADAEAAPQEAIEFLKSGLKRSLPSIEHEGRAFSREAAKESEDAFAKSVARMSEYFQGVKQEGFLEEARIKKRLGEIQSKLYFTEDGVRERKLQMEQERLTRDLHALKKRNMQASEGLSAERLSQVEKQRRLHEPKLRIRLLGASLMRAPSRNGATRAPEPAPEPISQTHVDPVVQAGAAPPVESD